MPSQDALKRVTDLCSAIQSFDLDRLRSDPKPTLSMADARLIAKKLIDYMSVFTPEVLQNFDDSSLNSILNAANSIGGNLDRAANWKVEDGSAAREECVKNLRADLEPTVNNLKLHYVFAQLHGLQPESLNSRFADLRGELTTAKLQFISDAAAAKEEANALLAQLKKAAAAAEEAAGLTGAAANARFFGDAVGQYETEADKWGGRAKSAARYLIVAIALLTLLPFLHLVPYFGWLKWEGTEGTAQLISIKIVILAPILYWIVLCARNYMAHKHNGVVNRHRQNALQTFKALVGAAHDTHSQDIILTKAAEAIFGHQESGFIKGGEAAEGPKQIVEMFKRD